MSIMFECVHLGRRYVGFGKPGTADTLILHPVTDQQAQRAIIAAGGDVAAIRRALTADGTGIVEIRADDGDLRYLPPLLPTVTGDALLSGFMRTHRSKFDAEPGPEEEFVPPNWFFKGLGSWLRMPGDDLAVPARPVALIEEPEIVLVYACDGDGVPHYAGYTLGNDLCDIGLHRRDPGWNPYCKLCDTSITPWLFLGEPPRSMTGTVTITRDGVTAWEGAFDCGTDALYFQVHDMINNLFHYPALRRPNMVHYVLLGADKASFHDGFRIADGDRIAIDVKSHDVTLANTVRFAVAP